MLSHSILQSAVCSRVARSTLRPAAAFSSNAMTPWRKGFATCSANDEAPWRKGGSRISLQKVEELRPRLVQMEQSLVNQHGQSQQLTVHVTFRELTEVANGLRNEFTRLRDQISLVGQACEGASGVSNSVAVRPVATQLVGNSEPTDEISSEIRKLREEIALVGQAQAEVSAMKADLKKLREEMKFEVASVQPSPDDIQKFQSPNYASRFRASFEVSVSKLFPGGFGWQLGSNIADGMGYASDTFGFALTTGLGDALGVGIGHITYFALKKVIYPEINMGEQISLGTLLGSAAVISGTIWQPLVNLCGFLGLGFPGHFAVVGVVCGAGFYAGLRIFRALYCNIMIVAPPTYQNLVADAQLSVSIAGATGTFTATDPSLVGNIYAGSIGVSETDAALLGCVKAGGSTWLGFLKVQAVQNIFYPNNRNWIDGPKMKTPTWSPTGMKSD